MPKYSTEIAIVKALKGKVDGYISGEELAGKSSISRTAIWKHIKNLKEKGYEIEAVPRRGYRLISAPDRLLPEEIIPLLKTKFLGKRIVHFESVDSTNTLAKELAEKGEKEGTVVIAEEQRRGKGRLNRTWASPRGGIWLSVILRPKMPPLEASRFTLLAAVAVAKAIEGLGIVPEIKWPNDILVDGKKICGILLELSAQLDKIEYLVIGFGINANFDVNKIPKESRSRSTTLAQVLGTSVDRRHLVASLLFELEKEHKRLLAGQWDAIREDWLKRCTMLHENIELNTFNSTISGEFIGVDDSGALQIRLATGDIKTFAAGDVTVKKR